MHRVFALSLLPTLLLVALLLPGSAGRSGAG